MNSTGRWVYLGISDDESQLDDRIVPERFASELAVERRDGRFATSVAPSTVAVVP